MSEQDAIKRQLQAMYECAYSQEHCSLHFTQKIQQEQTFRGLEHQRRHCRQRNQNQNAVAIVVVLNDSLGSACSSLPGDLQRLPSRPRLTSRNFNRNCRCGCFHAQHMRVACKHAVSPRAKLVKRCRPAVLDHHRRSLVPAHTNCKKWETNLEAAMKAPCRRV